MAAWSLPLTGRDCCEYGIQYQNFPRMRLWFDLMGGGSRDYPSHECMDWRPRLGEWQRLGETNCGRLQQFAYPLRLVLSPILMSSSHNESPNSFPFFTSRRVVRAVERDKFKIIHYARGCTSLKSLDNNLVRAMPWISDAKGDRTFEWYWEAEDH